MESPMVAFSDALALEPMRVHVAAADPLVRSALTALLARVAGLNVASASAELVLWDARGGERALPLPGRPTLALVEDAAGAHRTLGLGARGAIRRDAGDVQVAAALQAVRQGLLVLEPAFQPVTRESGPAVEPLTAREREVLVLLAEGFSNKEIATRLRISEHTAKFHVNGILQKLSAERRTDAVVRAARLGLITL
jgi:two-component system nitrate/nitrite response regulator NarL